MEDSGDAKRSLHELQVHQIELEMQNRELLETQDELQISNGRYYNLFDFAPMGYVIFDDAGCKTMANLMLDVERAKLITDHFVQHVAPTDVHIFHDVLRGRHAKGITQLTEFNPVKKDGSIMAVQPAGSGFTESSDKA